MRKREATKPAAVAMPPTTQGRRRAKASRSPRILSEFASSRYDASWSPRSAPRAAAFAAGPLPWESRYSPALRKLQETADPFREIGRLTVELFAQAVGRAALGVVDGLLRLLLRLRGEFLGLPRRPVRHLLPLLRLFRGHSPSLSSIACTCPRTLQSHLPRYRGSVYRFVFLSPRR